MGSSYEVENGQRGSEPVAIVGMGCRWPGEIRDAAGLWDLLKEKRSAYGEFKAPRFSAEGFHHPNSERPGTMATRGGFLVSEDARLFDGAFFGIHGAEVETLDPSQRKLLEVVYEALENAGETLESVSGSNVGVFVGNFALDHWVIQSRDWDYPRPYALTGAGASIFSNRISYIFNLHGPSLTLDTACSSSMYAVHLAVNAIRSGDCDSAIVAASNWIMDPCLQMALDKLGTLSPTSTCHTFDTSADGYARGEGFAALYLKRVVHAAEQGSPIRAVIRGTAANANGRTAGITRPSPVGQEAVIRRAYDNAGGLPFSDTTFFECHGTGTPVGDPIEVAALSNVFASSRSDDPKDRLLIGSVKTNLGHTEGASALASIMKVVLALEKGTVPPSIGIEELNPAIDFAKAKVEVVREVTPWPSDRLRRASINSFGFGGANAHCIIDHVDNVIPGYMKPGLLNGINFIKGSNNVNGHTTANGTNGHTNSLPPKLHKGSPQHTSQVGAAKLAARSDAKTRQLVLLPFSAHNETSLKQNIHALLSVIEHFSLADIAYTLGCRRSRFPQRSFRIVDRENAATGLGVTQRVFTSPLEPASVGFVFTGQGAQWPAMGAQLFVYRVFREAIAYLDHVLTALATPPLTWTLTDILLGQCDADLIHTAEISQTVCTAVQIGLVDLLASWSVHPAAVVGHSSGEIAAAYASGHITATEAITAAYFRGRAVSKNRKQGTMLAVGLGLDQVVVHLEGKEEHVTVACINSPASVTLSGDSGAIREVSEALSQEGVFNRVLKTGGNAYHSHHMTPLGCKYSNMLSTGLDHVRKQGMVDAQQRYPSIPWISSVTPGKTISESFDQATYWRANLESPVRFAEAVTGLMAAKAVDMFVEVGPHPALKGPIDQILRSGAKSVPYASTLKRGEDSQAAMLQLVGTLFGHNVNVDIAAVNAVDDDQTSSPKSGLLIHGCTAVDLPPYQYTYGPVRYHEGRLSKELRHRCTPRHDLLGSKLPGTAKLRPQWRNILRLKDLPWLKDHRLLPHAVFPAAAFVCMTVEAAAQVYHEQGTHPFKITGYSLRNVSIKTALRIPEDDYGVEVVLSLELNESEIGTTRSWMGFSISSVSQSSEQWTEHCTGVVKIEDSADQAGIEISFSANKTKNNRALRERTWYAKFAELGLGYGPAFQGLSDLHADPDEHQASAKVALRTTEDTIKGGESNYSLHPSSLDAVIQLGLVACHGGQVERATTAYVPIHLSQLYLRHRAGSNEQVWANATARGELKGLRGAHIQLQLQSQSGDLLLSVDHVRCISYSEGAVLSVGVRNKAFSSPFGRVVWKPDIRCLSGRQARVLFPPPEDNVTHADLLDTIDRIATLMVVDIYQVFICRDDGPKPEGNLSYFFDWVKRRAQENQRVHIAEARQLSDDGRRELLRKLRHTAERVVEVEMAYRLHASMEDILYGRKTGLDIVVSGGLLTKLHETGMYMNGAYPQLVNILDSLGHANPHLRILEVGGGIGGATRVAMKALVDPNTGIKRYSEYTLTDISPNLLEAARKSIFAYQDVNFSVLDIGNDPVEQGYDRNYDVVLCSQTLHAGAGIDISLQNCRRLLRPGGKLVLVEGTQNTTLLGIIHGTLTGCWGASDGHKDGAFSSLTLWDCALQRNGFSGTDIVLDDCPPLQNITAVLVSTVIDPRKQDIQDANKMVYLIDATRNSPLLLMPLADEFKRRSIQVEMCTPKNAISVVSAGSRVVVFVDSEEILTSADEQYLKLFQHLARTAASMVWLTSCGIAKGSDPGGAFVMGLLRTISSENPGGRFISIDIDADDFDIQDDGLVASIVDHEVTIARNLSDSGHKEVAEKRFEDREFVWQDGCMLISRVVPDASLKPYVDRTHDADSGTIEPAFLDSHGPVRAAFETAGILSSLYFRPYTELWQPLPRDWIELKVSAVGLNWKDLGLSTGRVDANNLSSEYAGVVSKLGDDVREFAVGDRVYGMGVGHFGNYTRVPARFAAKVAPADNIVEMATMPLVYMTVIYAFEHVVVLREGHKVLIQSATGGLGLSAIQLARAKGADVYATVGTPEKARFLEESMGLPPSHIFLVSRNQTSLSQAVGSTGNTGFDIILSTAKGDRLHESMRSLAPLGHLIDVGRLDVMNNKAIDLGLFHNSANFSSFDLSLILTSAPHVGEQLIKRVDHLYRAGQIGPIRPFAAADVSELDQVLLGFSKGTHVGKIVVTFQNPESLVRMMVPAVPTVTFDPQARYIVTGGFGGLGRSIVKWMCDRGARDFAIFSRRGNRAPEATSMIDSLRARGIHVQAVACDLSSREHVLEAVNRVSDEHLHPPVKGVVHAAVSYQDISFDKLDLERWRQGMAAKVAGTRNLHEATASLSLDFFFMTTSGESFFAPPTQSIYTAANDFQDAFARWRRSQGLPASTVLLSLVSEIGSSDTLNSITANLFERNKIPVSSEHQFLNLIEPAFLSSEKAIVPEKWIGRGNDPLSAANIVACLDPAALAAKQREDDAVAGRESSMVPRWYSDGRVALIMRALEDARRHAGRSAENEEQDASATSGVGWMRREFSSAIRAGPAQRAETIELVTGAITAAVAGMLFVDMASVSPARTVAEHGVDSLIAAELRNWFVQALGANISMLELLDAGTKIGDLAANIVDNALSN